MRRVKESVVTAGETIRKEGSVRNIPETTMMGQTEHSILMNGKHERKKKKMKRRAHGAQPFSEGLVNMRA